MFTYYLPTIFMSLSGSFEGRLKEEEEEELKKEEEDQKRKFKEK